MDLIFPSFPILGKGCNKVWINQIPQVENWGPHCICNICDKKESKKEWTVWFRAYAPSWCGPRHIPIFSPPHPRRTRRGRRAAPLLCTAGLEMASMASPRGHADCFLQSGQTCLNHELNLPQRGFIFIFLYQQCSVVTKTLVVLNTQTLEEAGRSKKLFKCQKRQNEMLSAGSAILQISNWGIGECALKMLRFHFNLSHGNFYCIARKKASLNIFSDLEISLANICQTFLKINTGYTHYLGYERKCWGSPKTLDLYKNHL